MKVDMKAANKTRTFHKKPKRGVSVAVLKAAKEAQALFATGTYSKNDLAEKLKVSRPTLNRYLDMKVT